MEELDKPYTWYQDLFCKDLGLCRHEQQDWGYSNYDSNRVGEIAKYYLDHPEYSRVGREMLIESFMTSLAERLRLGELAETECNLALSAVKRAMADKYDREALRVFWEVPDLPHDPNPAHGWLRKHFPDWTPPPSVWSD